MHLKYLSFLELFHVLDWSTVSAYLKSNLLIPQNCDLSDNILVIILSNWQSLCLQNLKLFLNLTIAATDNSSINAENKQPKKEGYRLMERQ